MNAKRIDALSGVKGWFIYFVVIYHTFNCSGLIGYILSPVKLYGGYFVDYLFFLLSGFLTCYSFSSKKLFSRSFGTYIKKKLIKLYPMYAISNLWQLCYLIFVNGISTLNISFLIQVLTMQTGGTLTDSYPYNRPSWFLCTLFVCYIINYLLRYLCKDNPKKYIWCFYGMFIFGIVLIGKNLNIPFLYVHDGEGFANFFLGCIMFEHYRLFKDKRYYLYVLAICTLFCLIYPSARLYIGDVRYLIIFLIIPVVLLLAIEEKIVTNFFRCKISQFLGKISMNVFFLHSIKTLSNIPSYFPHYKVGYAIYILILILISSLATLCTNFISSKKRKKIRVLSYID